MYIQSNFQDFQLIFISDYKIKGWFGIGCVAIGIAQRIKDCCVTVEIIESTYPWSNDFNLANWTGCYFTSSTANWNQSSASIYTTRVIKFNPTDSDHWWFICFWWWRNWVSYILRRKRLNRILVIVSRRANQSHQSCQTRSKWSMI